MSSKKFLMWGAATETGTMAAWTVKEVEGNVTRFFKSLLSAIDIVLGLARCRGVDEGWLLAFCKVDPTAWFAPPAWYMISDVPVHPICVAESILRAESVATDHGTNPCTEGEESSKLLCFAQTLGIG